MSSAASDPAGGLSRLFLSWSALLSVLGRGYWLVASLYLVLDADLAPEQLVLIGVGQGIVALLFEVPTGVVADTVSRRMSLVIAHLVVGLSMIWTATSTAFPILMATQMLWGIGWTFASGADVAWITDELNDPARVPRVLAAQARWKMLGAVAGLLGLGALAWVVGRAPAMMAAGVALIGLGVFVALRFPERHFQPRRAQHLKQAWGILRTGLVLARRDRAMLILFAATFLLNGASDSFGRLYPIQLIALGFPDRPDPVVWFTALGIAAWSLAALTLCIVERRLHGVGVVRWAYVLACAVGAVGLGLLAIAPNAALAAAGVLFAEGVGWPVTRALGSIWVNERATREVRATVQSFLAQVEYFGEIVCGLAVAGLAQAISIAAAVLGACVLVAVAGWLALASMGDRR